ncbi:MAG: hypothetical protein L0H63_09875, partial [Nitrococcus sp.]|nr:hypothetical protein [Nitrococcus sp.]
PEALERLGNPHCPKTKALGDSYWRVARQQHFHARIYGKTVSLNFLPCFPVTRVKVGAGGNDLQLEIRGTPKSDHQVPKEAVFRSGTGDDADLHR